MIVHTKSRVKRLQSCSFSKPYNRSKDQERRNQNGMLCVGEMAEALIPDDFAHLLDSNSRKDVIIIDCRPLLVLNKSRVHGANDVHCPPIVKRRSGGNIPLENILRDSKAREAFLSRSFSCIVVYDDCTNCLTELTKDSNMYLVIKTLKEERCVEDLYFLQGGFQKFQAEYSHHCTTVPGANTSGNHGNEMSGTTSATYCNNTNVLNSFHGNSFSLRDTLRLHSHKDKDGPVEVLPWLYIGNLNHALQIDLLLKVGISTLINMAASTETSPLPNPHFYHKNIPVRDSCSADILQWFPDVINFIESVRRKKGKVLVHCQAGISRSATVCIAYLMFHKAMDLEQAFDYLKAKRAIISPNLNFMRQLTEFQVQLREGTSNIRQRSAGPVSPKVTLGLLGETSCLSEVSALGLPLTPCTQQAAAAFAFDSSFIPTTACGPSMPLQSPVLSPS